MTKRRTGMLLLILSGLFTAILILRSESCEGDEPLIIPDLLDSSEFETTDVAAHIGTPIDPRRNLIYCATSQVAWNDIRATLVKAPLEIEGAPPSAEGLNDHQDRGADLPQENSICMVGYVNDGVVDHAKEAIQSKFGHQDQTDISISPSLDGPLDVVAISFLEQNLSFTSKFYKLSPRSFAGGADVMYFGIDTDKSEDKQRRLRDQIVVHQYSSKDNFVIELVTDQPKYQLMLAKIPPRESLLETVLAAQKRVGFVDRSIQSKEELEIPIIHIGMEHRFPELFDKEILNHPRYRIKMWQAFRFRLDRRGAQLTAKAKMEAKGKSSVGPGERSFIFDKPFLLSMKMKEQPMPYFAMWVANPEVLQKN